MRNGTHDTRLTKRVLQMAYIAILSTFSLACGSGFIQAAVKDNSLQYGVFLYDTDDVSGDAAEIFRARSRSAVPQEAETATFYLGRYYQDSYYIRLAKYKDKDPNRLQAAKDAFHEFLRRYDTNNARRKWISDTRFYKSLVYLQLGDLRMAMTTLRDWHPVRDPEVYIRRIIWSDEQKAAIDRTYSAWQLREATQAIIEAYSDTRDPERRFWTVVNTLGQWCLKHGTAGTSPS
jgi:hypothetical protein